MSETKSFDKEIELQKIQILQNDYEAWFNTGASLWVGGLIGLLILILTVYYNKQFNPNPALNLILTVITAIIVYILFAYYGIRFMNRRSNTFLALTDQLLANVEKGIPLGSVVELRKKWRGTKRQKS